MKHSFTSVPLVAAKVAMDDGKFESDEVESSESLVVVAVKVRNKHLFATVLEMVVSVVV